MSEPASRKAILDDRLHIPMRRKANSIGGHHTIYLRDTDDGKVQVEIHGTDAQGEPTVDTRVVTEAQYEDLRSRLYRDETATLPKFGSLKTGNTLGRVVGETAPTALPAVQANPPAEVETEEEESWWSIASPWVHGGLDALGFVPGLGAIPDIINAGIYAVEGDAVNAGLSGVGAIPIFGDAVKGGVLVGKTGHKAAGKLSAKSVNAPHNPTSPPPTRPPKRSDGSKIKGNGRCKLYKYKENKCKGLIKHHLVPDRAFRYPGAGRSKKTRNQIPGGLSDNDGLVICVSSKEHTAIHSIYDRLERELGRANTPPGTAELMDLEALGAAVTAKKTGCKFLYLEAQLRAHHQLNGMPPNFRVRADKRGNLVSDTPLGTNAQHSNGIF